MKFDQRNNICTSGTFYNKECLRIKNKECLGCHACTEAVPCMMNGELFYTCNYGT